MENAEEVLQSLDSFSKLRPKDIPRELEEYLCFVARTGDPVYHWSVIKSLFREKLLHVLTEFHDSTPGLDLPLCPNVDPFNYDTMKNCLLERIESFSSAPFTVQRICELLTCPRKQYSRIDKYMRAIEKNILVVSTREPGNREPESGDSLEAVLNGDGFDMHIEIEMDADLAWKEAPVTVECSVTPPNDTSYSILTDNSSSSSTQDNITSCESGTDKHHTSLLNLNTDKDSAKQDHPETSVEESEDNQEAVEQSVSDLLSSSESDKAIVSASNETDLLSEQNSSEDSTLDLQLTESSTPSQPPLETFIPNNDTEESTDTSETDSNLTEDSVTSELPENTQGPDENTLAVSDVDSSNDETPYLAVQNPEQESSAPIEIAAVNEFHLRNDEPQISIIDNEPTGDAKTDLEHDKIESNMEKLFQIVCETTESTVEQQELCVKTVEDTILSSASDETPIITEPYEVEQTELKDVSEQLIPVENTSETIISVCEPESIPMVDVVENDCNTNLKPDETIAEPLEQDPIESMDIPESAMEVEDTPISEPMDQ